MDSALKRAARTIRLNYVVKIRGHNIVEPMHLAAA